MTHASPSSWLERPRATVRRPATVLAPGARAICIGNRGRCITVSISPGSTARMRTPVPSSSAARMRDRWSCAALEMPYCAPARVGLDGRVRRDVHDGPGPAERHRAGEDLGQAERTDEVGLEHRFEVFALHVEEQAQRRRAERARVVDRDREIADQARGLAGDAMDRVPVADVAGDRVRDAAVAADRGDHVVERAGFARHERHACALRRELLGERATEAAARTVTRAPCP